MNSKKPHSSDDVKRKKRKNDRFLKGLSGITSVLIVSAEGLPIAYSIPQDTDETKIAAMFSALLSLSEMAILEMGKGDFDQLYIKGQEGYLLVMQAGQNAVLAVSTAKDVRLGLVLLDCRRVCEKIAKFIYDGYDFDDDDDYGDRYPYSYIFKPPEPPGDIKMATQLQVNKFIDEELDNKIHCQYCGRKLTEEEWLTHNCRKSLE